MLLSTKAVLYLVADASLASLASAFATTINHQPTPPHNPTIPESRYVISESSLHNPVTAYPSLAISDSNLPGLPEQRSQDQQIQAALPLGGTVRDTKWRIREERGPAFTGGYGAKKSKDTMYCTSTVIFRSVAGDSNRGTVEYDPGTCQTINLVNAGDENSDVFAKSKGLRWVSKTTRVIQLTARWKVKLPEGRYIYKGYIDGGRRRQIEGMSGQNKLEMTGTILTGDDDATNRVVGKFTADLIDREI